MKVNNLKKLPTALVLSSFLLNTSFAALPVFASIPTSVSRSTEYSVSEKVFFATTRKWDGKTFSSARGSDTTHQFGVGTFTFSGKNTRGDMRDAFPEITGIGWSQVPRTNKDTCEKIQRYASANEFLDSVGKALSQSKSDELVVFVHGYFNNFDDAITGGAQLGSYFKCPVIAYSWPTPKTVPGGFSYHVAEGDVGWSQEAFTSFIKMLLVRFPGKISIVCHSMGSRLVAGSLLDLHRSGMKPKIIKEVAFASADFDSRTFANRFAQSLPLVSITRFYISPEDKALWASKKLYGDNPRLGAPGDDVGLVTPLPNTQVIDFRKFGGGITGHNIAFWLISNMHKYNRPGGKWHLTLPAWLLEPNKK